MQGWQLLSPRDTSFFAAVNLPMLDFHSSTGPQADFNSGACSPILLLVRMHRARSTTLFGAFLRHVFSCAEHVCRLHITA